MCHLCHFALAIVFLGLAATPAGAGPRLRAEREPNESAAEATPLGGPAVVVEGKSLFLPDAEFYSFRALAGDRIFAATQSMGEGPDLAMQLRTTDGVTVIEGDAADGYVDDPSLAGTAIPANGTHYVWLATQSILGANPYRLYFQLRRGTPPLESEPNDTLNGAAALPPGGWVAGTVSSAADVDYFALPLQAGDTVFLSLDTDPERDAVEWLGRITFYDLIGAAASATNGDDLQAPNSVAIAHTVAVAGTYKVAVAGLNASQFGSYQLNVTVFPALPDCQVFAGAEDVPLPAGSGELGFDIVVPGNPIVADLDVEVSLTHGDTSSLGLALRSPAGNEVVLLRGMTDVGVVHIRFDDEAALPPRHPYRGIGAVPSPATRFDPRLSLFDGEDAGGTWTLRVFDQFTGASGMLDSWRLYLCPRSPCGDASQETIVFARDFTFSSGGFTHSGTDDEWERGQPAGDAIAGCAAGTGCFKTDIAGIDPGPDDDGFYESGSFQTLVSPPIDLQPLAGTDAAVLVRWSMAFQTDAGNGVRVWVRRTDQTQVRNLFEWRGGTMKNIVSLAPFTQIEESAGWGVYEADITDYAGEEIELLFYLDGFPSTSSNFEGLAIDEVQVVTRGLCFHTLTPCRVLDTRLADQGPALGFDELRVLDLWNHCGIPPNARAVSANVTAVTPGAAGYLRFWPLTPPPGPTSTLNFSAGVTRANNAVLGLEPRQGRLRVGASLVGIASVHLVFDVNGYFE